MNKQEINEKILGLYKQMNLNDLPPGGPYVGSEIYGGTITLDGVFSKENLEKIIEFIKAAEVLEDTPGLKQKVLLVSATLREVRADIDGRPLDAESVKKILDGVISRLEEAAESE